MRGSHKQFDVSQDVRRRWRKGFLDARATPGTGDAAGAARDRDRAAAADAAAGVVADTSVHVTDGADLCGGDLGGGDVVHKHGALANKSAHDSSRRNVVTGLSMVQGTDGAQTNGARREGRSTEGKGERDEREGRGDGSGRDRTEAYKHGKYRRRNRGRNK